MVLIWIKWYLNTLFFVCCLQGILNHYGQVTPLATKIWVNTDSGNSLSPDGTKPLPEPMLTWDYWLSTVYQKMCKICWQKLSIEIFKWSIEIIFSKIFMHLLRGIELKVHMPDYQNCFPCTNVFHDYIARYLKIWWSKSRQNVFVHSK